MSKVAPGDFLSLLCRWIMGKFEQKMAASEESSMSEHEFFARAKLIFLAFCITVLLLVLTANHCEKRMSALDSEIKGASRSLPPARVTGSSAERDPIIVQEEKLRDLQKEQRSTSNLYLVLTVILQALFLGMAAIFIIAYCFLLKKTLRVRKSP